MFTCLLRANPERIFIAKYGDLIGRGQTEGQALLECWRCIRTEHGSGLAPDTCACFFFLFVICAGFAAGFIQVVENAGTSRKRKMVMTPG